MRRIAIGVVVGALALAACGSSSKKSTPAAGGSSTSTATTTNGNSGGSGDNSDLTAIAGKFAKAKIKITYTSGTSSFTFAQDGNGKSSYGSGDNVIYTDGKSSVSCQGTGATAKCIDAGNLGGAGIGSSLATTFSALAGVFSHLSGGDKSSESIAGRDAQCVTYSASDLVAQLALIPFFKNNEDKPSDYDSTDKATICVDKDTGFVVKISGTKKGKPQDSLTATAISEPSDSDFTPPVTPQTLPSVSLPSGVTLPTIPSG